MKSNGSRRKRVEDRIRKWMPYVLLFGIVSIGGSSMGLWLQQKQQTSYLRGQVIAQAESISGLQDANKRARTDLSLAKEADHRQDQDIVKQRSISQRQERAIHHLSELRFQDQHALVGLHDELAAQHTNDTAVRARLELLEQNNAVARSVISNTPAPAVTASNP